VNYKKLLREQGKTTSTSNEKSSAEKRKREALEARKNVQKGTSALLEGTNQGGHMAAVIRRIEALYQGGRGGGSSDDEDEEEEDESGEDDDGEDDDGEEGESAEEDDSGSEMEDPDDKPTMTPNGTRVEPLKTDEKTDKPAKKKKAGKKKKDSGWYDVDDDFIDDDELDEYFEDDGLKTKHSGFFINKGELQRVDEDGRTPVKAVRAVVEDEDDKPKKKDGRSNKAASVEWTQENKQLLRKAVQMYGLRWQTIHDSGEFDELKPYSAARMSHQWKLTQEDLLKRGISVIIPSAPPTRKAAVATTSNKENDDQDVGLTTPEKAKRAAHDDGEGASTGKKQKKEIIVNENDPRHPDMKKRVLANMDADLEIMKNKVAEDCEAIRQELKSHATTTPPAMFKWKWNNDTAALFYTTLARLFFATAKIQGGKVWVKVITCWPKDFDVTIEVLRKKYLTIQRSKSSAEKNIILGLPATDSGATTPT